MWTAGNLSVDVADPSGEFSTRWVQATVRFDRSTGLLEVEKFRDGAFVVVDSFSSATIDLAASTPTEPVWAALTADGAEVSVRGRAPGPKCCGS